MIKESIIFLLTILPGIGDATPMPDPQRSKEEAISALKGFNPGSVLKGFTNNPQESQLQPAEGSTKLSTQGLEALKNNKEANDIYFQAKTRTRIHPNPKSPEMDYAEKLLKNPDKILDGECYTIPGACTKESSRKQCTETVAYTKESCKEPLIVKVKPLNQTVYRTLSEKGFHEAGFDLQSCSRDDPLCIPANTILLAPNCAHITISVTFQDQELIVMQQPSCTNSQASVFYPLGKLSLPAKISIIQYLSEEHWESDACRTLQEKASHSQCKLYENQSCLEPDQTKVIDSIPIQRPCWGKSQTYQCPQIASSDCSDLIHQGCVQVTSECMEVTENLCLRYSQTFECSQLTCKPETTICPGKRACADGACDISQSELSDDMAEGVSRLGVLAEGAKVVADNQVRSDSPRIFTGVSQECREFPLGFRDCCKDSGWGDWVKNCPKELQDLQGAKKENRTVYLGSYHNHKLGAEHHSFCVFPSKLAAIVQIQGRAQLSIGYGSAEFPNCRGLTPEELGRIDFSRLNLSPIEQELMVRMTLPQDDISHQSNQSHIERLNQEGRAHD